MSTSLTPLAMDAWLWPCSASGPGRSSRLSSRRCAYAEDGFPVSEVMREDIVEYLDGFRRWPANADVFSPRGRVPDVGDMLRQPALAEQYHAA